MSAAARVDPKTFFTPDEWTPLAERSSWKGLALVAHAWGVIVLAVAAGVIWPILIPLCIMIVGARQLGLAILMHEAAHGGLSPNGKINDFVGQWLCAVPIGANLNSYRPYHLKHHRYAQQDEDPDLVLCAPFPVTGASLRRKMFRDLTGQTFFKQRFGPVLLRARQAKPDEDLPQGAVVTASSAAPFILVNAALLLAAIVAGAWWSFFVLWLLPMATWFPLVTRLRNIAEHAVVPDKADPLRHARTTRATFLERAFLAPYWVNYHCEHHMFMYAPCWRLPRVHAALGAKGVWPRMEVAPDYLTVLKAAASAKA
jgi:fatty acid desaturase